MPRFLLFCFLIVLASCSGNKRVITKSHPDDISTVKISTNKKEATVKTTKVKSLEWKLTNGFDFNKHFTGLVVYDPIKNRKLFDYNGSRYFTPASNLKLFTFYTCLKVFNEQALCLFEYLDQPEGLYIKGTGHPGFLHPELDADFKLIHFLRRFEKDIFFSPGVFLDPALGAGWSWDDATAAYQCERTGFPIHGNLMTVFKEANQSEWVVNPNTFSTHLRESDTAYKRPKRDLESNDVLISQNLKSDQRYLSFIPIKTSDSLVMKILSDTLYTAVKPGHRDTTYKKYYHEDHHQLYHQMLYHSNNMISEQLLLHASYVLFDTMSSKKLIKYSLENYLSDLTEKPRWVDGSGLSRYNLASPFSMVQVLDKINQRLTQEQIEKFFTAIAIKDKEGKEIWLYAKSGTLSNNYNLSGYIKCRSGKLRIFSFMNNHYLSSTRELKDSIKKVLVEIYETY